MMDFGGAATMGGGGPMITGKWTNTRTGEEVTVRDSFMDGDDMVIFLTDGRQLTLGDFQDYVQMSEEEYDEQGNMLSGTNGGGIGKPASTDLPKRKKPNVDAATIFAGMDEKPVEKTVEQEAADDLNAIISNSGETPRAKQDDVVQPKLQEKTLDGTGAAYKVLHKVGGPKFTVKVEWPDFPKKELQMCKDFFDTTDDDIAKSIINMHCSGHELEAAITEWLVKEMKN